MESSCWWKRGLEHKVEEQTLSKPTSTDSLGYRSRKINIAESSALPETIISSLKAEILIAHPTLNTISLVVLPCQRRAFMASTLRTACRHASDNAHVEAYGCLRNSYGHEKLPGKRHPTNRAAKLPNSLARQSSHLQQQDLGFFVLWTMHSQRDITGCPYQGKHVSINQHTCPKQQVTVRAQVEWSMPGLSCKSKIPALCLALRCYVQR